MIETLGLIVVAVVVGWVVLRVLCWVLDLGCRVVCWLLVLGGILVALGIAGLLLFG